MPLLRIPKRKLSLQVDAGANLMNALLELGLPVASSCKGDGVCTKCKLEVKNPDGALFLKNISKDEIFHQGKGNLAPHLRLSCQVRVEEDLEVDASYW
jgi:2Fe-2S ferredoxin